MTTTIAAPYPNIKVTTILPSARFEDSRTPTNRVVTKRSMLGRLITYVKSSDVEVLKLPLQLTRMKSLELEAFVEVYRGADWLVTLYDGSQWYGKLVGQELSRSATERLGSGRPDLSGTELIEVTIELAVKRL